MNINDLIENNITNLINTDYYSAIIGLSPSKGAKSPKLWNSAFNGLNLSGCMYPFDVVQNNLGAVVDLLKNDLRFIGGSVAAPYKTEVIKFLDKLELNAKKIGAVNCIYRNESGDLIGANTDGAGALWSLKNAYGDLNGKNILLLGAGGAAAAVATYIGEAIGLKGKLFISNRNQKKLENLVNNLNNICNVQATPWPVSHKRFENLDIIINTTSIGFENPFKFENGYSCLKFYSPLWEIEDEKKILNFNNINNDYVNRNLKNILENIYKSKIFLSNFKNLFVFDIVYQPELTYLLFISNLLGHKTLSGIGMNLEQAVIAFDKTISASVKRKYNVNEVRKYMKEAI